MRLWIKNNCTHTHTHVHCRRCHWCCAIVVAPIRYGMTASENCKIVVAQCATHISTWLSFVYGNSHLNLSICVCLLFVQVRETPNTIEYFWGLFGRRLYIDHRVFVFKWISFFYFFSQAVQPHDIYEYIYVSMYGVRELMSKTNKSHGRRRYARPLHFVDKHIV